MKNKINWKQKLTSRKFLVTAAPILVFLFKAFFGEETALQIVGLVGAAAASLGYVYSEATVDASRADMQFERFGHNSNSELVKSDEFDKRFGNNSEYCQYTIDAIAKRVRELELAQKENISRQSRY